MRGAALRGEYAADVLATRRGLGGGGEEEEALAGSGGGRLAWDSRRGAKEKSFGAGEDDGGDDALDILYQRAPARGDARRRDAEVVVDLERVSQRLLLERQDLEEKIKETRREFRKLARRKLVLEDEWKKINVDRADLEEDKRRFTSARRSPWFQSTLLPTSEMRRVRISVGGQLFETTEKVLRRDPGSLLAALVGAESPIKPDERGCYIIDRDWVLFRHILTFLRDGALPQAPDAAGDQLIARLYKEADFYRLETLRCAIREFLDPYQLVEKAAAVPLSRLHKLERQMAHSLKHLDLEKDPYLSGDRLVDDDLDAIVPDNDDKEKDGADDDWWTSSRYKGRDFRALPPDLDEASPWRKRGPSGATRPEDFLKDAALRSTWHRPSSSRSAYAGSPSASSASSSSSSSVASKPMSRRAGYSARRS